MNPTPNLVLPNSSIHYQMLMRAAYYAKRSTHSRFKTGAIIVSGEKEISSGWSHTSNTTLSELFSVHAEIHSLLRAPRTKIKGATLYIATLNKRGKFATSSCPCKTCGGASLAAGISTVYYTTNIGAAMIQLSNIEMSDLKHYQPYTLSEADLD